MDNKELCREDFERILKHRLHVDGATQHMGIEIKDLEPGWARAEMQYRKTHANPNGSVYGGLIFSLADAVAGTAACTHGNMVTTTTGNIHFLNAAFSPKKLIAEAREMKAGRSLMTYDVKVKTETGKLIAQATMEYFRLDVPVPGMEGCSGLEG